MTSKKKSILWELSKPNSVRKSYLFGTMHVKNNNAYSHVDRAFEKLETCQLLLCEYNLNDAQGRGMDGSYLIPNGQDLRDFFTVKRYDKLRKIVSKAFQLDLNQFSKLLPMTFMGLISEQILQKHNKSPLDQFVWDKGITLGLELGGLESFESQLEILKSLDMTFQIKMLNDALKNVSALRKRLLVLSELYHQQEIHKLYKLSKKSLGSYKDLLLNDRNVRMVEKITTVTATQNVFVAVGAAHLSGKKGLIHLLKKEGFKIKPCS